MTDDPDTWLIDNDPARLLPYSKEMLPEDPEAVRLPKHFDGTIQTWWQDRQHDF